jgi:hypothetical protein
VKIQDQTDAVPSAEWKCREDEPVWNAVRVHHIDWALAVNAEKFSRGQHGEASVLHDVGTDPRSLMALDWLAVELRAIELAVSRIAVTLQGDDADVPAGGDRGSGGATNAWILIYIGVHHER